MVKLEQSIALGRTVLPLIVAEHVVFPTPVDAGMLTSCPLIVGAVASFTVTVKLQLVVLQSVTASISTVVVPIGNTCGEVITVCPIL